MIFTIVVDPYPFHLEGSGSPSCNLELDAVWTMDPVPVAHKVDPQHDFYIHIFRLTQLLHTK